MSYQLLSARPQLRSATSRHSGARWPLESFLTGVCAAVTWAIEQRGVFCFLGHPSCLVVTDPAFRTIEMIGDQVRTAGDRAALVDLNTIALAVRLPR